MINITPKFLPFIEENSYRFLVVVGGRGSGKSMTIAQLLLLSAGQGKRILACREYLNSIHDSIHSLLVDEIDRLCLPGFSVTNNTITHRSGGSVIHRGLARNPESLKSLHDIDICFVDEAQTISDKSLRLLTPTIRAAGSQIWLAANPRSKADPFTKRFISEWEQKLYRDGEYRDAMHYVAMVNHDENPWFPEVLRQELDRDREKLSRAEFEHIWEGKTLDEVANAIIPVEWFDAAIGLDDHPAFRPSGAVVVGFDPSDMGGDDKGVVVRHGAKVLDMGLKDSGDAAQGLDWSMEYVNRHKADVYCYDADGLGLGLAREVERQLGNRNIDIQKFHGGERPINPDEVVNGRRNADHFFNRRAQGYWDLRERFENAFKMSKGEYVDPDSTISLPKGHALIDQLRSEVCRIPRKPNAHGKVQLVPKHEMAKEPWNLPSPNLADALVYCFSIQDMALNGWDAPIEYTNDSWVA